MKKEVEKAIDELRKGNFILVYDADGREEETDFFIPAEFVKAESIYRMRKDGGGLIFIMLEYNIAKKLGLPYLSEIIYNCSDNWPLFREIIPNDIPYDTKSSFSLTINHRKTFTGIRDIDRAMTISKFAEIVKEAEKLESKEAMNIFGKNFRSPGHVPICISAKNLLKERNGHTELGIALAEMAGLTPVMAGCEMLDFGESLSKKKAREYALMNGLVFVEGYEIVEAWEEWQG
ncbi:MAG: 3,4-dihydroxy-2-butanone-4-phosphate synthase [Thermoplasmatales archaeon]|nr:3,4-dihydroxy-2-butanone-4-phosphate synthase [Thermoplasmatales archaeon]